MPGTQKYLVNIWWIESISLAKEKWVKELNAIMSSVLYISILYRCYEITENDIYYVR